MRSRTEHVRLAEELTDLANDHMRKRDDATHRHGPRARRLERRHYQNSMYVLAVAQVHASLAGAIVNQF